MERYLEFEKFRNMGFGIKEKLILNNSLEKGKMGNLVIIVGANNSGKSNVLDGLLEFGNRNLTERDVTTLSYKDEDRVPSLTLSTRDGENVYSYKITYGKSKGCVYFPKNNIDLNQVENTGVEESKKELEIIRNALYEHGITDVFNVQDNIDKLAKATQVSEIEEINNNIQTILSTIQDFNRRYGSYYTYAWQKIQKELKNHKGGVVTNSEDVNLNNDYLAKYGINFFPKIYKYSERQITDLDFKIPTGKITGSGFFKALFSAIDFDIEELNNAYKFFGQHNNKGVLNNLKDKINKKLKSVAKSFNSLYVLNEDTYKFEIDLESNQVFFTMYRNGESIVLDYQSTGFKWFFNLYFNLLCSKTVKAGDIVIMDEPATNLHVKGQQELRAFLKDFAIKNDITIVLATHSPFLIDMDYLDELRVVSVENNLSHICNDFSTIDVEDPDSLKPIKEALTVSNHILYNPDVKVVFVEGITDYNYMVAFKKKFKKDNIAFLPIRGVGNYNSPDFKDKQMQISKRLISIRKQPILMVDGDRAGKSIKNINNDSDLSVFTLTDVNQEFKEIENLFSISDLENLGIKVANGRQIIKSSSKSALFKTFDINNVTLSKETEDNFRSVFEYIENEI